MSSRQRISARDYKHGGGRRGAFDIRRYTQFGLGLATGLAVALAVFVSDHRSKPTDAEVVQERPKKQAAAVPDGETDEATEQYDFYDMLPKFEVCCPRNAMCGGTRPPSL